MLDQIIILQDSAQRLLTTYNSLTYRVLCSDNSFRDLANSIKAVSVALDSCRGLLEQIRSGTTSIPITTDLSPRLETNIEECKTNSLTTPTNSPKHPLQRATAIQSTSPNPRYPPRPSIPTPEIPMSPRTGHTALHDMCTTTGKSTKTTTVIESLLEKGADPTATLNAASSQLTAIHLASYHNNVAALEATKESMTTTRTFTYTPQYQINTRYTQFQATNYTGQWKWKNLLKRKDSGDAGLRQEVIDSKDREGRTALLVVGLGCNKLGDKDAVTKIAKALVKAGTSPDVADWRGQTPRGMLTNLEIEKPAFSQKEQQTYDVAEGYSQGYGGYQGYRYQGY
ncbi:hypothetical protein QC761_403935 [Podospora bellae-mahoneyi]|uniref:Ankyrin repeat protein n=1 Tax=Podospora bellae-mahoneyi TaxID=2093777 RepID=A0ABR0FJW1_9PEZI|nr:hypothetical protein QC761_403935 [Podospora bellae-mahoneyi]